MQVVDLATQWGSYAIESNCERGSYWSIDDAKNFIHFANGRLIFQEDLCIEVGDLQPREDDFSWRVGRSL